MCAQRQAMTGRTRALGLAATDSLWPPTLLLHLPSGPGTVLETRYLPLKYVFATTKLGLPRNTSPPSGNPQPRPNVATGAISYLSPQGHRPTLLQCALQGDQAEWRGTRKDSISPLITVQLHVCVSEPCLASPPTHRSSNLRLTRGHTRHDAPRHSRQAVSCLRLFRVAVGVKELPRSFLLGTSRRGMDCVGLRAPRPGRNRSHCSSL